MKIRSLLSVLVALAAGAAHAKEAPARVAPPEGVLPVIVLESLHQPGNAYTAFDRLDLGFQKVVKERKWPLKVVSDRMADGIPDYLTEVEISLQPLRQRSPGEYAFRAWTVVYVDGKKHDLGIIHYDYHYRIGRDFDDEMDEVFVAGARAIAEKIEPLLFPDLNKSK
jgi:hypothetical protein